MALCTQTQVEQRLGVTGLTAGDITEFIAAATGHIERVAGRPIEDGAVTETFDGPASTLWLEVTPVNSITSIEVDGTALTSADYTYTDYGRLARTSNSRERSWTTTKQQSIVVVYNGGYQTVPYDLQDVCANMAARMYQASAAHASIPAGAEGIKSVMLAGSDSVTYKDTAAGLVEAVGLTEMEVGIVSYYRPPNL